MRNFFYSLIGVGAIGYLIYVVVQIILIIVGASDTNWLDFRGHLIGSGMLVFILILAHFFGKKEEKKKIEGKSVSSANLVVEDERAPSYNLHEDMLHFDVYQQQFKTWWFDKDGDKHNRDTIYSNLRFYEDGTVIGIRSSIIPKLQTLGSFTMKGNWIVEKNNINISLKKTSEIDDSIEINTTESEKREMKYYGELADDESLIKAGEWKGIIRGDSITFENHSFIKLANSTLIITASEEVCGRIESKVSDHPYIISTFQDSGNWYTNGETGPEWFTVHICTSPDRTAEIEKHVNKQLKDMDEYPILNLYWG